MTVPHQDLLANEDTDIAHEAAIPSSSDHREETLLKGTLDAPNEKATNNDENLVPNPQKSVIDESALKASIPSPLQQSLAPYLSN